MLLEKSNFYHSNLLFDKVEELAMKIIGNTLETIHKFRHENVSQRFVSDPFLAANAALGANRNIKLQLVYLDTNETFYLVENTSSIARSLQYNDGAIVVSEWSTVDFIALMQSYDKPGFDNYFQLLVNNTAQAHEVQEEETAH